MTAWLTVVGTAPPFMDDPDRACIGIPTDEFYPSTGDSIGAAAAKQICYRCPLMATCQEWAVDNYEQGIWGATSERERTAIRDRRDRNRTAMLAAARRVKVAELTAQHLTPDCQS